jgi:hypothetical protein
VRKRLPGTIAALILTLVAGFTRPVHADEAEAHDPLEGMDPDGRIPAADRPPEVTHPERWRYIPEGRIKPGNILERFMVSSFIAPFAFRSSDIGFGGGLAITDIDFREQRRREFAGAFVSYSEEGQQGYSLVWRRWMHNIDLPGGGVLQEERSFWHARAGYRKTLTRRLFGLGPGTQKSDESSYTDEEFVAAIGAQRAVPNPADDWVFGGGIRAEFHELSGGKVGGEPDTEDAFSSLFDEAEHADLGWISASLAWDTRDSQRNPYRGWLLSAETDFAAAQRRGDLGAVHTFHVSPVVPVPALFHDGGDDEEENPPTDTLAFSGRVQLSSGDLPFFALPALGGQDTQRGFIAGRFRDRAAWQAAAEWRIWVIPRGYALTRTIRIERIGIAPFYEIGSVADDGVALFDARVHQSYGIGFRLTLERAAPFRVDVGFSDERVEVTATFGLAF